MIRRVLLIAAIAAGLLAAFAGTPQSSILNSQSSIQSLAAAIEQEKDHITALELAAWIHDRKPGLRVIDLRSAEEFEAYHLPRAEHLSIDRLVTTPFSHDETIVLLSDGGAHAAQAWVLLQARGHRQSYFLRGGVQEWLDDVMNPVPGKAKDMELSRYFGGTPRVGDAVKEMRRRGC